MEYGKVKKYVRVFGFIFGIGLIVPAVISFIINGADSFYASNFVFASGLVVAAAGGAGLIVPFSILKSKIRNLRIGEELVVEKKDRLRWEYICLAAGAALILVSYIIAGM